LYVLHVSCKGRAAKVAATSMPESEQRSAPISSDWRSSTANTKILFDLLTLEKKWLHLEERLFKNSFPRPDFKYQAPDI
ncbi:hypothetical protein AVEN_98475-1, partial [Araneus ventricosus]